MNMNQVWRVRGKLWSRFGPQTGSLGIFIGPEGGFDENEIQLAREMGAAPISLGKRILRTETAAIAVLSLVMMKAEGAY